MLRKGGKTVTVPLAPRTARAVDLVVGERATGAIFVGSVSLRDVQEAASHADPHTAMRYDRVRIAFDRHATYIAGAAR